MDALMANRKQASKRWAYTARTSIIVIGLGLRYKGPPIIN